MSPRVHLFSRPPESPVAAVLVPAPASAIAGAPPAPPLPRQTQAAPPLRHGSLLAAQSLFYIIVVAIFIITFIAQPFRIPSESMEPSLLVGDFLLVNKQATAPHSRLPVLPASPIRRGEIIVFHYPVDPAMHLVKRVIGLPGDHIRLRRGRVFVNDLELTEPYAVYRSREVDPYRDNFPRLQTADPDVDSRWWLRMRTLVQDGQLVVPPDSYFVLGDNRDNSEDSRYWGLVPRSSIVGQPIVVYFSLRDHSEASLDQPPSSHALHRHRSFSSVLVDLARWDRTFHIIR